MSAPAPVAPAPATPETKEAFDPIKNLAESFGMIIADPDKKEIKADETPPAPAPDPAPPAPVEPPVEVVPTTADALTAKIDALTAKIASMPAAKPEPAKVEAAVPVTSEDDDNYVETLTEEQKEEIELAKFVAESGTNKEMPKLLLEAYRKLDKFHTENPEADDDELKSFWLKTRPKFDKRKAERLKDKHDAVQEAAAPLMKELNATRQKLYEMEVRPQVEKAHGDFMAAVSEGKVTGMDAKIDKAVIDAARTMPASKFIEEYPVEAPAVGKLVTMTDEFLRLRSGLAGFDFNNPIHAGIGRFVIEQSSAFEASAGTPKVVSGKSFAPWHIYQTMPEADKASHWSFSDSQILEMMAVQASNEIKTTVSRLEKHGFKRADPAKPATPAVTEVASTSPTLGGTKPSIGASPQAPASSSESYIDGLKRQFGMT